MLFENYRDNLVYSSQSKINFPRSGNNLGKVGQGSAIFLMCPNRQKSLDAISDPIMNFVPSLTKRFVTDTIYKERIGTSRIMSLERANTDRYYLAQQDFPLTLLSNKTQQAHLMHHLSYGHKQLPLSYLT